MIKAIIFDLDNTLIDRQKAFTSMLNTELPKICGEDERIEQMVRDIIAWDDNGNMERIDSFQLWIDKYDITQITAKEFAAQWSAQSGTVAYLFDDVRPTLSELKKKYKVAVLSNGDAVSQRRKMSTIDIYEYLDYSLISGEYTVRKPNPDIFQYVAKQLGVLPAECVYVGDNYAVDVEGSKKAGMTPVFVNRENHPATNDITIRQISELLNLY